MTSISVGAERAFSLPAKAVCRAQGAISRTSNPSQVEGKERWSGLMAAAQGGNQRAYDSLLREIVPFIRAIARRHQGSADRVEEVVQEVLFTMHRVRHTYDPTRPFSYWLAAITRRRSIDALRCRCRRATFEVAQDSVGLAYERFADAAADRLAEAHATADHLNKAIIDLPPRQREAIELLRLRELSLSEAATLTGRSVAALKVNVHRALKSLQQQLHA